MVEAINLKKGMIFEMNGKLIKVLEANHHKPGKGNTVMQMKLFRRRGHCRRSVRRDCPGRSRTLRGRRGSASLRPGR